MGLRQLCTPFLLLFFIQIPPILFGQQMNNSTQQQVAGAINIRVGIIIAENDMDYGLKRLNVALNCAGGAIPIALDRLWAEGNLSRNVNFSFVWQYDECDASTIAGYGYNLIVQQSVDVLIAPPCPNADIAAIIGTTYNIPLLMYGNTMASNMVNPAYVTNLNVMPSYADFTRSLLDLFGTFNWTTFSFVYQADGAGGANAFARDLTSGMASQSGTTLAYILQVIPSNGSLPTNATLSSMQNLKNRSRIIVLCFDDITELRKFALACFDSGMNNNEYVYVIVDHDLNTIMDRGRPQFWFQKRRSDFLNGSPPDGRDEDAKQIGNRSVIFHVDMTNNSNYGANFSPSRVLAQTSKWPFQLAPGTNMSLYAPFLHDVFYLYGLAIGRIYNASSPTELATKSSFRDGQKFDNFTKGSTEGDDGLMDREIIGVSGNIRINSAGLRRSYFALSRYYLNGTNDLKPQVVQLQLVPQTKTNTTSTNATWLVLNATSLWYQWNGILPLAVPLCGFEGTGCPKSPFEQFKEFFIAGFSLFALAILVTVFLLYKIIRTRMEEMSQLDSTWRVSFTELGKWPKSLTNTKNSHRSLSSGPSGDHSIAARSGLSSEATLWNALRQRGFVLRDEMCVAQKLTTNQIDIGGKGGNLHEIRSFRQIDHENLNNFLGICCEVPPEDAVKLGPAFALWRYCPRGSLRDCLRNERLKMFVQNAIFVESLAGEVMEGLGFLHKSPVQCHGRLHPSHCLLDQNWKVKLTEFGLISLKGHQTFTPKEKLWLAPEMLRQLEYRTGSELEWTPTLNELQKGDIYDLGLLLCEMINGRECWEEEVQPAEEEEENEGGGRERRRRRRRRRRQSQSEEEEEEAGNDEEIEKLLSQIRRGGSYPKRPLLAPQMEGLNPGMLHLIRDCWKEEAEGRPKIYVALKILKQMQNVGRRSNRNVMDHVFGMLEQYAEKLEEQVDERTKELGEEKRKADLLLGKLLPKEVANRLKLGEPVPPEHFELASVLFSDLVAFTLLSGRLSPLAVVNVINQLFTAFDAIIEEHDVYKVETIGDGYLCVSGLPRRNGNEHCRHISDMALKFLEVCNQFMMPELKGEKIRIRIGIHTGPVVAGVVGLSMPRYCLFGDTVNTASRMESNSLPNRIQLTQQTNRFLTEMIGGYRTESRGEVIIKGKGVMETFWLLGYSF